MHTQNGESITLISAVLINSIVATSASNPLDALPLSAGITGAMLTVLRSKSNGDTSTRFQLGTSFLSGVAASFFLAPAIVRHVLGSMFGPVDLEIKLLTYLMVGLTGSTFIDVIIERRRKWVLEAIKQSKIGHWVEEENKTAAVENDKKDKKEMVVRETKLQNDDSTGEHIKLPSPSQASSASNS